MGELTADHVRIAMATLALGISLLAFWMTGLHERGETLHERLWELRHRCARSIIRLRTCLFPRSETASKRRHNGPRAPGGMWTRRRK